MKRKGKTIDDYVDIGLCDIYVQFAVLIILFVGLLIIGYVINWYYIVFFDLFLVFSLSVRISVYWRLKRIRQYLIDWNLIDKIGNIDFWNDNYYFLTDNYMIVSRGKRVFVFSYKQIKGMYKEREVKRNGDSSRSFNQYLHVITDEDDFKILIWTTNIVFEDFRDISDYLLKKNPSIVVDGKD